MKDFIKEIPLMLFVGVFSIPIVLGRWALKITDKYIGWAWKDDALELGGEE